MTLKKVLITGATGFLGRHVLETLTSAHPDAQILVLVRDAKTWTDQNWTRPLTKVRVITGDIDGDPSWSDSPKLKGLTGIFHLAALVQHSRKNTGPVYKTNIDGTLNMVRLAARYSCRLVFVSTSGTVGCFNNADASADENAPYCEAAVSRWPYYDSKIKAEKAARALAESIGVELVVIRPPILLGPGDHRFRSTGHVIRALRGKLPFLIRGGVHFTDIRDAAAAIVKAMSTDSPRPIYHLDGTPLSVDDFFSLIERVSGAPKPKKHLPYPVAKALSQASAAIERFVPGKKHSLLPDPVVIEMASRYWGLSSLYSRKELDYVARDPADTLTDTVSWLRKNHPELRTHRPSTKN